MEVSEISDRKALRSWYEENSETAKVLWIRVNRGTAPAEGVLPYLDAVEEALCFGWIDSTVKKIDDGFPCQRFSPRKPRSYWTELNKERCRRLIKLGLMTRHGRKTLPSLDIDSFEIEDWVADELRKDSRVWRNFKNLPPLYVRVRVYNIQYMEHTKRHETAMKRLEKFVEFTRENKLYGEWNDGGRLIDY